MMCLCSNIYRSIWVDDNDKIRVLGGLNRSVDTSEIEAIYKECGYVAFNQITSIKHLASYDGMSIEDLKKNLRKRSRRSKQNRKYEKDKLERYFKQRNEIKDYIISVDKEVDDFDTGFSVFVLMKTTHTRNEQVRFVKENTKLLLSFVENELKTNKRKKKYADLLPFCYVSNITITNRNEAVVTFELKEHLQSVLSG